MAYFCGKYMINDLALKRPLTFNIQSTIKHTLSEYSKRQKGHE